MKLNSDKKEKFCKCNNVNAKKVFGVLITIRNNFNDSFVEKIVLIFSLKRQELSTRFLFFLAAAQLKTFKGIEQARTSSSKKE